MNNWNLYHGTSKKMLETIQQYGFVLGELRFYNWLSPQGIYFVPNRPLIARRFAKQAGRSDFSEPVVLEVQLKTPDPERILDLSTDKGMNRFYLAYIKAHGLLSTKKLGNLGSNAPREYVEYLKSIRQVNKHILDKLDEAHDQALKDPRRFNWDTAAIRLLVDEYNIQLVIALVQEGTSFNRSFSGREPRFHAVPHYSGVKCRDHIEVCVTDLSLIDLDNMRIRTFDADAKEFHEDFINFVTNIDIPDSPSPNI